MLMPSSGSMASEGFQDVLGRERALPLDDIGAVNLTGTSEAGAFGRRRSESALLGR